MKKIIIVLLIALAVVSSWGLVNQINKDVAGKLPFDIGGTKIAGANTTNGALPFDL